MLALAERNRGDGVAVKFTRISSLILFLVGFYFVVQDQSIVASSMVVLSSMMLLLVGNFVRFSALLTIPAFASVQLLFAFSLLDSSTNYTVSYGPLRFAEYIEIASPIIFGYLIPYCLFRTEWHAYEEDTNLQSWRIDAICLDAVKWGLLSEIASNFIGGVPVVGALLWYSALLWKLAIPVLFFRTQRRTLAIVLALLLLLMAAEVHCIGIF